MVRSPLGGGGQGYWWKPMEAQSLAEVVAHTATIFSVDWLKILASVHRVSKPMQSPVQQDIAVDLISKTQFPWFCTRKSFFYVAPDKFTTDDFRMT